ncbi:disulfide bond formation protein B [Salicibibacter halophilus]|uniref:Probable disulfide formation protein n=1 Tax=Salicibibacter halophilus TaxID=2502791 RepID=A0A514LHE4_9BACI|nr:disulfide oxidoreductase [Salicibibacter halophilus]QDI91276.1 disulfide bond formation protein B [Salicibibacter halophilus]
MTRQSLFLYAAWVLALISTFGSLYFSEVAGFVPCEMCWYQRIAMYPLAVILGIATFRSDFGIRLYAMPFSIIGAVLAALHYAEQKIPAFGGATQCADGGPCSAEYINWFGFMTIPFLALIAFLLITICLLFVRQSSKEK